MQRKERAKLIRDHIRPIMHQHGRWEELSGHRYRRVDVHGWTAFVFTSFSSLPDRPPPTLNQSEAPFITAQCEPALPCHLDLFLSPGRKVLSIDWDAEDRLNIISMRPGAWEQELFGLPRVKTLISQ